MKICHVCHAECEDMAELCPVCGADLTDETQETGEEGVVLHSPVLVATLEDVVSAEIFKDMLKGNGIPFSCDGEDGSVMKVTFGGSFIAEDIYVEESDFARASEIYEDFLNTEPVFEEERFGEDDESASEE